MPTTTDDELKELVAGLAVAQAETDRQLKAGAQDTDRVLKELAQEARRQERELRQQIGGLANKFGGFTEGLALPSMEKLLTEKFQMEFLAPNVRKRRNGRSFEVDVMAYSNTRTNAVYLVEVKSRLREEGIDQILGMMRNFFDFFPEHRGKELYGILAVVDASEDLRARVLERGLYLARISGEVFELQVPEAFEPRSFATADEPG